MIQNGNHGAALDPNHSHFIFVDKGQPGWGAEIAFRTSLEDCITKVSEIPVVLVVVQGGPGTLKTVEEGARRHFPIILVQGSGGVADVIATCVNCQRENKDKTVDLSTLKEYSDAVKGYSEAQKAIVRTICDLDREHPTIFPFVLKDNATSEMDSHILNAILSGTQRPLKLQTKMKLCVEWNRTDILKEVLKPAKRVGGETQADLHDHQLSLNQAFHQAIKLDRIGIYALLLQHGAQIPKIDLDWLYRSRRSDNLLNAFAPESPTQEADSRNFTNPDNEEEPLIVDEPIGPLGDISQVFGGGSLLDLSSINYNEVKKRKRIKLPARYHAALRRFEELEYYVEKTSQSNETTTTDLLIWAVFSQKDKLAFEIWKSHDFSLHAALLCAYIYNCLAQYLPSRKKEFEERHQEWEEISYEVLDRITTPEMAHTVLEATWPELRIDAVKLAVKAETKSVVSHSYFQKVLDQRLFTSENGSLETGTSNLRIILIILFPFLFMTFLRNPFRLKEKDEPIISQTQKPEEHIDEANETSDTESVTSVTPLNRVSLGESQIINPSPIPTKEPLKDNPWSWQVYHVPIVKLWTKNLAYVLYLGIVSSVALSNYHYQISVVEYILGFWVTALISDEFYEYQENPEGHFDTITNKLDFSILFTWVIYFILRICAAILEDETFNEGAVYLICLIVVAGCLRAMQIFQLNPVIGPLLIMINKMAHDVVRFFGMFLLLFIGSQIAMISVARNIGVEAQYEDEYPDNWKELYPKGVELLALWGFVGEFSFDALKEWPVGYILIALYIMFAAIMMQNLLIAMMADSYQQINENAETEWKFERFFLVEEQQSASTTPPPFNIFEVIWTRLCGQDEESEEDRDQLSLPELGTLKSRLSHFRSLYLEDKEAEEKQSLSNRSDALSSRLEDLHTRRIEDREYLDRRFKEIKAKLNPR